MPLVCTVACIEYYILVFADSVSYSRVREGATAAVLALRFVFFPWSPEGFTWLVQEGSHGTGCIGTDLLGFVMRVEASLFLLRWSVLW